VVYNEAQNTYTFTKDELSVSTYKLEPINVGELKGIANDTQQDISVEGYSWLRQFDKL